MRARFVILSFVAVALYACIDSPTVELVGSPDAATSSPPALAPDAAPSSTSAPPPSPPTPACDQARCAGAGGTCTNDVCTVTCEGEGACGQNIKCPAGMPCSVNCIGKEACENTVECRDATSCAILCNGENACKQGVVCMGPQCAVTCENKGCSADEIRCCASACTLNGIAATCP